MLLASGYIAGGTLVGLIIAFFTFLPKSFNEALDLSSLWNTADPSFPKLAAVVAFAALAVALTWLAVKKERAPKQPRLCRCVSVVLYADYAHPAKPALPSPGQRPDSNGDDSRPNAPRELARDPAQPER